MGDKFRACAKPILLGQARNLSPILVDNVLLTFQVHDGTINSIDKVFDRANPLTPAGDFATYAALIAAAIPPGNFGTCLAEGFGRLGAPPEGALTVDAVGPHWTTIVSSAREFLKLKMGLVDADFDTPSFNLVATEAPFQFEGLYLAEPSVQGNEFLETAVAAINGYR